MRKDSTAWSEEEVATLRRMWSDDVPALAISKALGRSRKAVQGKSHHIGLPRRLDFHRDDFWPQDRIDRLAVLWAGPMPARAIALELGVTRSAVIGKAGRLGLPQRDPSAFIRASNMKRAKSPTGTGRYAGQHARKKELASGAPKRVRVPAPKRPKLRVFAEFVGPPAPPRDVKSMKLIHLAGVAECRWPAFESAAGHLFCCRPTAGKSSYCREHAAMSIGRRLSPLTSLNKHDQGRPGFYEGDFPEALAKVA